MQYTFYLPSMVLTSTHKIRWVAAHRIIVHHSSRVTYYEQTGTTALMLASQSKCTDVIKALLAHPNLDIDLADKVSTQPFSSFIMVYCTKLNLLQNKRTALNYAAGEEVKDMLRGAGMCVSFDKVFNQQFGSFRFCFFYQVRQPLLRRPPAKYETQVPTIQFFFFCQSSLLYC